MAGENSFYPLFLCKGSQFFYGIRLGEQLDICQIYAAGQDSIFSQFLILIRGGRLLPSLSCGAEGENERRISQDFPKAGENLM